MKVVSLLVAALGAAGLVGGFAGSVGCSSAAAPSGADVAGTFAGHALDVADTAAFQGSSATGSYLAIALSSTPGICSTARQHAASASSDLLEIVVDEEGGASQPALAVGTYSITGAVAAPSATYPPGGAGMEDAQNATYLAVTASFNSFDASCSPTIASTATDASSGTIAITELGSDRIAGSFDLHFPSGDHLTGHFASPVCSGDALAMPPTTAKIAASGGAAPETPPVVAPAPACVQ